MAALKNPGSAGSFRFDTRVYTAPGLNYSAVPALSQYQIYDSPHPEYLTGRIDISTFAQLGSSTPWPFQPTDVPLNGHVCVPRGRGPFPLAVFAHGNHDPLENSTPGYLYLCRLFASHGIIAATIDANFLNGFNSARMTRARSSISSTSDYSTPGPTPATIPCTARSTRTGF